MDFHAFVFWNHGMYASRYNKQNYHPKNAQELKKLIPILFPIVSLSNDDHADKCKYEPDR